jgi:hypothetical protein
VTLQGEDLFLENLPEPMRSQSLELIRSSAASEDAYIAVSSFYADSMSEYLSIPRDKIFVVPLGITLEGHGAEEKNGVAETFTVGYFARIAPEGVSPPRGCYVRLRNAENSETSRGCRLSGAGTSRIPQGRRGANKGRRTCF